MSPPKVPHRHTHAPKCTCHPAWRPPSAAFTIKTRTWVRLCCRRLQPLIFPCSEQQAPDGIPEETHWAVAGLTTTPGPHLWNIQPRSPPPLDRGTELCELKQTLKTGDNAPLQASKSSLCCLYEPGSVIPAGFFRSQLLWS